MQIPTTNNLTPIRILLVEDNPSDARLMDIHLKESFENSYKLSTIGSLSECLTLLKKNTFDIIVLDLGLPDSSGLETFSKIHDQFPEIPVIILTGLIEEQIGTKAIKEGAQDFLNKGTLKSADLKRSINYSIERFKLMKEIVTMKKNQTELKKTNEEQPKEKNLL